MDDNTVLIRTPGPWTINDFINNEKKGYIHISGPNGEKIADIFPFAGVGGVGPETARANARALVAAVNDANVSAAADDQR